MDYETNLRVLVFPADDAGLRREVDAALATLPEGLSEAAQIAAVERRLRRWYRAIQVRPRDTLGGYEDDPTRVWYVYRDGRIRNRNVQLERLYRVIGAARETERHSHRVLEAARDVARFAGIRAVATRARRNDSEGDREARQ
jgi:hypothetical protein